MEKPLIISGAPATGKTEVAKVLVKMIPHLVKLAALTTRNPRIGEIGGDDYNFVSKEALQEQFQNGELIEETLWECEFNNQLYGSPKSWINELQHTAMQLSQQKAPDKNILILSPSVAVANRIKDKLNSDVAWMHLYAHEDDKQVRLAKRNQITDYEINLRLNRGDGHNLIHNADINLNTTNLSLKQTISVVLSLIYSPD